MGLVRPERTESEIAQLPLIGSTEFEERLRSSGHVLTPETLVYVIRLGHERGLTSIVELGGRLLQGSGFAVNQATEIHRAAGVIWSVARKFGFVDNDIALEEYWEKSLDAMWTAVLAGRDRKPFWEQNFRLAMWAVCLDVARPIAKRVVRHVDLEAVDQHLVPSLASATILPEPLAGLNESVVLDAIRRLPAREATAAMLHWVDERPIEGDGGESVAEIMHISPSYAHRLLKHARSCLAEDPMIRSLRGAR